VEYEIGHGSRFPAHRAACRRRPHHALRPPRAAWCSVSSRPERAKPDSTIWAVARRQAGVLARRDRRATAARRCTSVEDLRLEPAATSRTATARQFALRPPDRPRPEDGGTGDHHDRWAGYAAAARPAASRGRGARRRRRRLGRACRQHAPGARGVASGDTPRHQRRYRAAPTASSAIAPCRIPRTNAPAGPPSSSRGLRGAAVERRSAVIAALTMLRADGRGHRAAALRAPRACAPRALRSGSNRAARAGIVAAAVRILGAAVCYGDAVCSRRRSVLSAMEGPRRARPPRAGFPLTGLPLSVLFHSRHPICRSARRGAGRSPRCSARPCCCGSR
jgi:hypothetical protein